MLAHMFPGQGSQKRGMGLELMDQLEAYGARERDIDALLGYSLRKLCEENPGNRLNETQYTQPALYVVNALHHYQAIKDGASPRYLIGHSLGEYNALHAAGVFDLMTGLRLVKKRGELMAQAKSGGMGAVVGLSAERVSKIISDSGLSSLDIANFNSPSQTIVSGPLADINRAGPIFESAGAAMYMPLQVSAAFHSRYVEQAAREYAAFLSSMTFDRPSKIVISNVTARPYPQDGDAEKVKRLLVEQITSPVKWTDSVRYLVREGVTNFKEMGPGNVLTRLVMQIHKEEQPA